MNTFIDKTRFKHLIKNYQFKELFNELGWDNVRKKESVVVENETYNLEAVAEKKGFVIFACFPGNHGKIPDYHIRKKIDSAVSKLYFEHLIIFSDLSQKHQIWQLVIREQGKPLAVRETHYYVHQEPELLFQKLKGLFFSIDDEEKIGIVDVKSLIQEQFNANAEKVTKRFYDQFKKEHTSFLDFIKGISENVDKDWYASLMLNRLMFIYFIQKKGFLDNDKDYLKNRLKATQEKRGKNKFYSFYRNFLLILFHKGLGSHERPPALVNEIGIVPYLNGGLFDVHHIEHKYKDTEISDEAFEQVFRFFDQYEWHLDTRITATGRDINPDVTGYIFEKYINDRASMGAYYTKEDITDNISKNCIIPYLFDEVKRHYPKAFNPDGEIWKLLQTDPDKYIYDAVKHGIVAPVGAKHSPSQAAQQSCTEQQNDSSQQLHTGENASPLPLTLPLPPEIAVGLNDVSKRTAWNKPAPPEYGLPTEIWREVVERRKRYAETTQKIENGEIHEINDLITYNLNIRQFAQDVIENSDDPEFIRHFYKALTNISILDPTCGSGAFLFAAINILEPLYEACIQRMENFVTDAKNSSPEKGQRGVSKYKFFEETLAAVKSPEHPNLQYFIYKNIILRNIYGVDIMHEAVEIAKLRLFLKLVATVDVDYKKPNLGLEPLPDIDFNIRSGNTLVGFARLEEVEKVKGRLFLKKEIESIKEQAEMIKMAYENFKNSQMIIDSPAMSGAKKDLETRLRKLNDTLNIYLAQLYKIDIEGKPKDFEKWKASHQPFHWFAEFYEIIQEKGGFDVVIGNPPYVEYKDARNCYKIFNYSTDLCANLYAFTYERSIQLTKVSSRIGFIIPVASICTDRYATLQNHLRKNGNLIISSFNDRPGKLFEGLEHIRLSIVLLQKTVSNSNTIYTSKYNKWYTENRNILFQNLILVKTAFAKHDSIPKLGAEIEESILNKINSNAKILENFISKNGRYKIYYTRKLSGFAQILNFIPSITDEEGNKRLPSELKELSFSSKDYQDSFLCVLNSSLFYWLLSIWSDCRNLNKREVLGTPFDCDRVSKELVSCLKVHADDLMNDFKDNSKVLQMNYEKLGTLNIQCIYPKHSKHIIDKIDKSLSDFYGFTDEELDFIINYDIKYRMGKDYDGNT